MIRGDQMRIRRLALVPALVLAMFATAVGVAGAASRPAAAHPNASLPTIVIGNEGFTESYIMQDIYSDLLVHAGFKTSLLPQASSSRAIAIPALEKGAIDVLPDYAGSLTVYLASKDQVQAGKITTALTTLNKLLKPKGAVVLPGTEGLDQNVFVVTDATQKKDHLSTISSVSKYAKNWDLGAPPECSTYYFCEPGLKAVYGLKFKQVLSLDESGPETVAALKDGRAEIAELFSTDAIIGTDHFYVLADNKNLEPADHLVAVVRSSFATAAVKKALEAANADLTTSVLTQLDASTSLASHPTPAAIAQGFLEQEKLI
jgi:osmoprotectant transport system substrate-binding protein